jgi:hypothetical protein
MGRQPIHHQMQWLLALEHQFFQQFDKQFTRQPALVGGEPERPPGIDGGGRADALALSGPVVNRRTRSKDILGPEQRLPIDVALKSITLWAAWQHFEEDRKGSIEPEKLADFVILSRNPIKVPSQELRSIQVLETIKEGKTIYRAKGVKP